MQPYAPPPQAYRPRRKRGCGCGIVALSTLFILGITLVVVMFIVAPRVIMGMAGFNAVGDTATVFNAPPGIPTYQFDVARSVPQVSLNAGTLGTFTLDTSQVDVQTGDLVTGGRATIITLDEGDLLNLCRQRSTLCDGGNGQIRGATVDLRPGGAVIYADVLVPQIGIWQRVGVVMQIDPVRARLNVAGVDVGGTLYNVPPDNLGQMIREIERTGNDLLQQAVLQAGGDNWRISELYSDSDRLTIILR